MAGTVFPFKMDDELESPGPLDIVENNRYLDEHHLRIYLEDAIGQILSLRQESNKIKPIKFFKEYFCSVQQGSHILFREFSFISATPYNRLCVLKAIMRIYKSLLIRIDKLSAGDYHSLLRLVWPDFPYDIIEDTFTCAEDESKGDVQIPFLHFITAFRKTFCLDSFTFEEQKLYQQLLHHEEEYAKIDVDDQTIFEGSDKFMPYLSEADLNDASQDNECESDASSWSLPSSFRPTSELQKLCLKESNSFSNDETFDAVGKLSHSYSGSKDSTKSEQCTGISSRPSSVRGRLKQLSNSLNLLQGEGKDKQDGDSQHPMCRLRSKSAVTIQRNSPILHKQ